MQEQELLQRITSDPTIFGGKPIIRGHRLAVEHVLGMLEAGDSTETLLEGYPWLELSVLQRLEHAGILRLVRIPAREQGDAAARVLSSHGKSLQEGAIVTVEPNRLRMRERRQS